MRGSGIFNYIRPYTAEFNYKDRFPRSNHRPDYFQMVDWGGPDDILVRDTKRLIDDMSNIEMIFDRWRSLGSSFDNLEYRVYLLQFIENQFSELYNLIIKYDTIKYPSSLLIHHEEMMRKYNEKVRSVNQIAGLVEQYLVALYGGVVNV